ncbi:MAG TPA: GNAT family N-acetyltransferase [Candidatus Nanoarchaeia archaeon]|nr:GNAT family N-acetyltransferase [Candidatus Nanoarchaeia archaeon]
MEVKIQFATIKNLKEIQYLNHQLCIKENKEFDATINPDYSIQKQGEEYFKDRINNGCTLITIVDGKVIGYLIGSISNAEDYRNLSKIAEAEEMFILEDYRSMKIGKKLLQEFAKWCKSKKVERIKVVAYAQNSKAIEFYRREGFKDYDFVLEKEI